MSLNIPFLGKVNSYPYICSVFQYKDAYKDNSKIISQEKSIGTQRTFAVIKGCILNNYKTCSFLSI